MSEGTRKLSFAHPRKYYQYSYSAQGLAINRGWLSQDFAKENRSKYGIELGLHSSITTGTMTGARHESESRKV